MTFLSIMMTSSNGNIFRVTGHLCGEFTGPPWIPRTKARDAELWCFLRLNKRFRKQSWGWWFETPLRSLWRHCNDMIIFLADGVKGEIRVYPQRLVANQKRESPLSMGYMTISHIMLWDVITYPHISSLNWAILDWGIGCLRFNHQGVASIYN